MELVTESSICQYPLQVLLSTESHRSTEIIIVIESDHQPSKSIAQSYSMRCVTILAMCDTPNKETQFATSHQDMANKELYMISGKPSPGNGLSGLIFGLYVTTGPPVPPAHACLRHAGDPSSQAG